MSDFSFSQVTSVEKRESQQHFSASAYGLGLKKLFLGFLFSTSVTWEKLKSYMEKFYFRGDMEKNQNKILFQPIRLKQNNYAVHEGAFYQLFVRLSSATSFELIFGNFDAPVG